jgi:hypothetical protein
MRIAIHLKDGKTRKEGDPFRVFKPEWREIRYTQGLKFIQLAVLILQVTDVGRNLDLLAGDLF